MSPDFFTTSACRDLLFHVQEHRFTLPRIAEIIERFGLEFLGFEFEDVSVRHRFRSRFGSGTIERSLEAWHEFEQEHPGTFRGMYQFWVMKPAASGDPGTAGDES